MAVATAGPSLPLAPNAALVLCLPLPLLAPTNSSLSITHCHFKQPYLQPPHLHCTRRQRQEIYAPAPALAGRYSPTPHFSLPYCVQVFQQPPHLQCTWLQRQQVWAPAPALGNCSFAITHCCSTQVFQQPPHLQYTWQIQQQV